MAPSSLEIAGTVVFALAVIHTFCVKRFQHFALHWKPGSVGENFFHLMGEIEIVFGLWAAVLIALSALLEGGKSAIVFVERSNFTEPAFVFVIMTMAASRPILQLAIHLVSVLSHLLPLKRSVAFYLTALVVGPLLGSLITEPAAMTVTALILKQTFFNEKVSTRFKYLSLGVLFVNVSIGGVLTHFAAPPVLMVASAWGWGTPFLFAHFGWKALIAVTVNASLATFFLLGDLKKISTQKGRQSELRGRTPWWLMVVHVTFLSVVIFTAHHPIFFLGVFLFFIGTSTITQEYQDELKLKESLLVGFFLAGLVILGGPQAWWLKQVLESLGETPLFLWTTFLTAFMDNAALTYLGAQVPNLSDGMKYALVAGAVSGGGLTVIANAPNPAGFAILRDSFGPEGISPLGLFVGAFIPTLVAMACLAWLP